jgi:hypothetical protein
MKSIPSTQRKKAETETATVVDDAANPEESWKRKMRRDADRAAHKIAKPRSNTGQTATRFQINP